ncbi:MAG: shikimate kinase [Acidobacteriota bacterium]
MSGPSPLPGPLPVHPLRIVLTGFMGAGKTTVGARLAARLGWTFLDSDRIVEERAGATVAEIFARHGESAFRDLEAAAVRVACRDQHLVLALGGGALERSDTRDFLASLPDTLIVFLEAPLETMMARCAAHADGPVRPVLADQARLNARWNQRLPWYRQAHLTVDTRDLEPDAVADRILQAAGKRRVLA